MTAPAVEFHKGIGYEEFLSLIDETTRAEWVDGEVLLLDLPTRRHAEVVLFLATVLHGYVTRMRLGGEVFHSLAR